jgi:hypothetical protein
MRAFLVAVATLLVSCSHTMQTHQRGKLEAVSTKALQLPADVVSRDVVAESCGLAYRTPYIEEAVEKALEAAPGSNALMNLALSKTGLTCFEVEGSAVSVRQR